ncbi:MULTISPECIES: quinone-dependent dihydroorotate dehydrogenase [unclassified Sphingomonas]|jgi:dihydroorotate dehydrogenase|uniref:quinone-dependent dihydroorotate dehydrogenase n=1 Tax=Sphingomonas TaxID=13687 RepID=UPI0009606188|nr:MULTISPECIES: quinone-dependent dihydroorotate dehydrogenase [unclassified Sphingomonas]MBN8812239.1 quinone-dependent dihydroorotate dehydrogenase [Sphingomonas sp.]OJY47945.1 MAG: dihydroorotate dehydrogenase (quinone) [Sphingomonas sp. 67-41]
MAYPLRSALFALDAERAHRAAIRALALWGSLGTVFRSEMVESPVQLGGLTFPNRIGLAAGLDKDAEAIPGLFALGFGAVEVGTLTPRPQGGNPRPRLFRLPEDEAVINRMGFNNGGIDAALARIAGLGPRKGMLGINVGANKDSADRVADYALGVGKAAAHADYVTINVSSPNTPGLRDLQSRPALDELLAASHAARGRTPLFLKIAPDLDRAGLEGAIRAALDNGIDALIVSNTTIARPPLRSAHAGEAGGLSGKPLAPLARQKLAEAAEIAAGALPLISAGGIDGPDEAKRRIDAGATLVQLYSALVFKGPGLPRAIARALA